LSAQFVTLQYSPDAQSWFSRRHDLPASAPASTVPEPPLDDVVPLDVPLDDVAPLDVAPLDDALGSPDDPKRPLSSDPPQAMATLAPINDQQARSHARRIR
jgi:hypothetical protein